MSNASRLLNVIQSVASKTVNAGNPSDYAIGIVVSADPLSIRLEQDDIIPAEFLVLTDAVRDYDVDIEVLHRTENRAGGSGDPAFESHNHDYIGRKKIRIYNALHVGESVIMLRQAGGQEFCVLSRVFNHTNLTGQWG